jgi:hypothetical protein
MKRHLPSLLQRRQAGFETGDGAFRPVPGHRAIALKAPEARDGYDWLAQIRQSSLKRVVARA